MNSVKAISGFDFDGARVTVMGLGRFGGGIGVTLWLLENGADVLVTDLLDEDELRESMIPLKGKPIELRLGEHNVSDFTDTDLVVANPAVDRKNNRFLRAAEAANVPITTEIEILLSRLDSKQIIGITGSAGKSTTTAMTGLALKALLGENRVYIGGNIGGSLLGQLNAIQADDYVVLELSSFMLEPITGWSPGIAVITNLSPNHLDRHGDMMSYANAKKTLIKGDQPCEHVILGSDIAHWAQEANTHQVHVVNEPYVHRLALPGQHNRLNAACVNIICDVINEKNLKNNQISSEEAQRGKTKANLAIQAFSGLPHRMQLVVEHNGLRFYNDSKSTTPASAIKAITAFDPNRAHIILGGYDKGADLREMVMTAMENCAGVYAIGATGPKIIALAEERSKNHNVLLFRNLEDAMFTIMKCVKPNQVVILSPGCASYGEFENYEKRGAAFTELALRLCTETGI